MFPVYIFQIINLIKLAQLVLKGYTTLPTKHFGWKIPTLPAFSRLPALAEKFK